MPGFDKDGWPLDLNDAKPTPPQIDFEKYSEDQPRDERGRFGSGGGGGGEGEGGTGRWWRRDRKDRCEYPVGC